MTSLTPTYNSAFPALYSVGLSSNQRRKSTHQTSAIPPVIHHSIAPPKIPSYLKQTLYATLALEQYHYHQHKHNSKLTRASSTPTLPKISNLEDEQLDLLDLRLPAFWNSKDKSKNIEVGSNGLDLAYIGPGKQETHAALARSNFPMRYQCGIFYYEMKVISKGDDGYIGMGFCSDSNKLERLPGWDPDSWGYHGDDGHSFAGSGTGKTYGPCFSTGDVIGCGVNFADNSAFYTKNGKFLGIAFTNMELTKPIYPAIGLRTPGEQVTANFGHEPFVFDIAQYVRDQKISFISQITKPVTTRTAETCSKEVMDQLILSYLIHHGYTGTAKAVVQNAGHVSGQELFLSDVHNLSKVGEKDMEERHVIRSAIVNGKIDEAIRLIQTYFPGVLEEEGRGQELQLWLKCGRFVEMMREYCEYNKRSRPNVDTTRSRSSSIGDLGLDGDQGPRSPVSPPPRVGRRLSYAAIAASLSPSTSSEVIKNEGDDMMDIDIVQPNNNHLPEGNVWKRRSSACSATLGSDSSNIDENNQQEAADALKSVMEYGQRLQEEYRHDTQEKTRSSLVEIFSLLAYRDPYCSPVAYLMNVSRRDALATEVNAAILAYQNRPEMPAMERIYKQIMLCNKELALEGNGKASLINIDDYCANDMEAVDHQKVNDPMLLS